MRIRTCIILFALLLPFFAFCDNKDNTNPPEKLTPSNSQLTVMPFVSTHLGGFADGLVPLFGTYEQAVFGNAQFYNYGSQGKTYSAGVVGRKKLGDSLYGINGYFDRQITAYNTYLTRLSVGGEHYSDVGIIRGNIYYYPGANSQNIANVGQGNPFISNNDIIVPYNYATIKTYNGADVEVGRDFNAWRVLLGYFNHSNVITGPKARLEYQQNPRVKYIAAAQHDSVNGTFAYVGASIKIGKKALHSPHGSEKYMLEPVVRDMQPAIKKINPYTVNVSKANIYFADPNGVATNPGTQGAPTTPQQAWQLARENDYIILNGGTYDLSGKLITVNNGQQIYGRSADVTYNGTKILAGDPTKTTTLTNGNLNLLNNVNLKNINLNNSTANSDAITISGTGNTTLTNVNVSGFNGNGVNMVGNAMVTFNNVVFNANGNGLLVGNGTATINTGSFNNNAGNGIATSGNGAIANATNVTTSGNTGDGIHLNGGSGNTTFTDITSEKNTGNGLYNASNNLILAGTNNFNSNKQNGINIVGTGSLASGQNITANNNSLAGIRLNGAAGASALSNIVNNSNGSHGLWNSTQALTMNGTNTFNTNTGNGMLIDTTGVLTQGNNITASNNGSNGIYLNGANTASTLTNVTANTNTSNGLYVSSGQVNLQTTTGNTNYFENNTKSGIAADTNGSLVSIINTLMTGNGSDGLTLAGTPTYTSTWTHVTSTGNAGNGYTINNANATVSAASITGDANTSNGVALSAGVLSVTGTNNSFSHNTQGSGVAVSNTGVLTQLSNATVSNNLNDGVRLDGTAAATTTLSNVTSESNQDTGFYVINPNVTINADTIQANKNFLAGMMITGGTVNVTGTNSFNANTAGYGILVNNTGYLKHLENATLSSNASGGLSLSGTGTTNLTLNSVTSNANGGTGLWINAPNANIIFSNLTSSSNTGNGLWLNQGTATDSGSTNNYFNSNGLWGILVGTSTTKTDAHLLVLTNAQVAVNEQDGIFFNSSATSDTIALTNISTVNPSSATTASNTGNGIYINQAGTFTLTGTDNLSHNGNSGLRINNANATMTSSGTLIANNNTAYGLRVANASAVTVQGSGNTFNNNGIMGAYIGINPGSISTTVNLNNIITNSNTAQHGIAIWNNTGTTTLTNVTSASNGIDGLNVVSSTVNILNAAIYNNTRDGIFANGGTVTFDNNPGTSSQIYGNATGGGDSFQIEVQNNAVVTVNNPARLEGVIKNTLSNATINILYLGTPYTVNAGASYTCGIPAGTYPFCSPTPP